MWLYLREALVKAGLIVGLFTDFDRHLKQNGYLAMGGQIIDATIVPVPKNRNSRERENESDQVRRDARKGWGKPSGQTATEGLWCNSFALPYSALPMS